MPTKKAVVVKSDADAAVMASAPAAVVRKRTPAKAKTTTDALATEVAPASGEKKARSSSSSKTVTHRHKKQQQQQESAAISGSAAIVSETKAAPSVLAYEPAGEDVAKLAYSYYVARGYQPGDPAADWFRAIHELKARQAAASYLLED